MTQHRIGQRQQTLQIGDVTARLVHQSGNLRLSHRFQFGQALIGSRFFDRIEVFALQVFDQGQCGNIPIRQFPNNCWYFMELCTLRSPPTAFPRDNLKSALR
jgi:hypothetical protein